MAKPVRRSIVTGNSFEQDFDTALPTFVAPKKEDKRSGIQEINLSLIMPNPEQPRTEFDVDKLQELADSIRVHGVITPVVLVPNEETPGFYWLVAGERRCRASILAGKDTVPSVIRESMERWQMAELALIENVQREDLNPFDTAMAYQRLMDEYGYFQEDLAAKIGKSQSSISRALQVLQAPTVAQEALQEGSIGMMTAVAMKGLTEAEAEPIVEAVKAGEMTQEQAKKEAKKKKEKPAEDMHGAYKTFDTETEVIDSMHGAYENGDEWLQATPYDGPVTEDDFNSDYFKMDRDEMIEEITTLVTSDDMLKFTKESLWNILDAIRKSEKMGDW